MVDPNHDPLARNLLAFGGVCVILLAACFVWELVKILIW